MAIIITFTLTYKNIFKLFRYTTCPWPVIDWLVRKKRFTVILSTRALLNTILCVVPIKQFKVKLPTLQAKLKKVIIVI